MRDAYEALRAVYQLPDHHILIPMEMAEHPGALAFEVLRMIPSPIPPRWIYERWTWYRLEKLGALDTHRAATLRKQAELVWGLVGDRYRGQGRSRRVIMVPEPTRTFPDCQFCGARLTEHERDGYLYVLVCAACGARIRYIYRPGPVAHGWAALSFERYPHNQQECPPLAECPPQDTVVPVWLQLALPI